VYERRISVAQKAVTAVQSLLSGDGDGARQSLSAAINDIDGGDPL